MCRFIVYHGPAITMASLVTEPEHAMLQLSMKAFCSHTPLNADGFGLAWYHPSVPVPGAYRDVTPAWNNVNLKQISRAVMSHCFFAHVRAASTGGVNYPNCHPFVYKNISFMHNGTVPYFKQVKRSMVSRTSERAYQLIQGTTDSEMMFAMFVTNFEKITGLCNDSNNIYHQVPGAGIDDAYEYTKEKKDLTTHIVAALKATLRQVHYIVLQHEYKTGVQSRPEGQEELDPEYVATTPLPPTKEIGRLNIAVTDGQSTCTARYVSSTPESAHSLYYSMGSKYECTKGKGPKVLERAESFTTVPPTPAPPQGPKVLERQASCGIIPPTLGISQTLTRPEHPKVLIRTNSYSTVPPGPVTTTAQPLVQRPLSKSERVVIVSSEPLAVGYNCEEVPVNHMVITGPNAHFKIDSCV